MTHSSAAEPALPLAAGEHPPFPGAIKIASEDLAERPRSAQTKARKMALDVLYQAELRRLSAEEILELELELAPAKDRPFTRSLVLGVVAQRDGLDEIISASAGSDWTIDRMPPIDRNLARIAIWEMQNSELDVNVIIAEAVRLADELSTDKSVRFLNGLLSAAAKQVQIERQ